MGGSSLNMIELLNAGLAREVKNTITEKIVKKEIEEFEEKIRAKIKLLVDTLSFDAIESVRDHLRVRDELHIFLHWKGEGEPKSKALEQGK